jgi:PPP family 3-phenylpropionic acid transporter
MFTHTSAMMPMSEAAMAHLVSHQGALDVRRYGRIRLWGSVGFLVTVFVSGHWFEVHGMADFPMWTVLTLLAINLSVWSVPNVREEAPHVKGQAGVGKVLRQPITLWFFATLFFFMRRPRTGAAPVPHASNPGEGREGYCGHGRCCGGSPARPLGR